jgi:hypothetical protein
MNSWRRLLVTGMTCALAAAPLAAETDVKPLGSFPLAVPGVSNADVKPKALLWCHGTSLLGVVVADEKTSACAGSKRTAPQAYLVRDGQCDADGSSVTFGFLLPRQAWVYAASGKTRQARTVWLLHRFEGSVRGGRLKGQMVQVDVSHPGQPFQNSAVETEALSGDQASFPGEEAWRGNVAQTFCLATDAP